MGDDTSVKPSDRAFHGFLHARVVRGGGLDDVVELHHDVGADGVLERHGVFRGEKPGGIPRLVTVKLSGLQWLNSHGRSIMRTQKADTFFCDPGQFEQRDHLEPRPEVSATKWTTV